MRYTNVRSFRIDYLQPYEKLFTQGRETKYTIYPDRKRRRNVRTIYIRSRFARIFAPVQCSTKYSRSSLYDVSYDTYR